MGMSTIPYTSLIAGGGGAFGSRLLPLRNELVPALDQRVDACLQGFGRILRFKANSGAAGAGGITKQTPPHYGTNYFAFCSLKGKWSLQVFSALSSGIP